MRIFWRHENEKYVLSAPHRYQSCNSHADLEAFEKINWHFLKGRRMATGLCASSSPAKSGRVSPGDHSLSRKFLIACSDGGEGKFMFKEVSVL